MSNLRDYLEMPLELEEYAVKINLKCDYPICKLGESKLYMNHYKTFEEAKIKREERKKRINWNNIFVMMYTERKDVLEAFDQLKYDKKVCFVPSDLQSAFSIDTEPLRAHNNYFTEIVNRTAVGIYKYYDVFELLTGNINYDRWR